MNVLWSKRYKHIMIQGVWTFCDWKDVNVFWPKIYKTVVTERLPMIINEKVWMDLDRKDVKLILTERVGTDLDRDQKGANGLWPKGCKWSWPKGCEWIVTEKLQTCHDQRVQMVVIERLRMGCDRKSVNGSWPKKGVNGS